jgi:hypothetical protein
MRLKKIGEERGYSIYENPDKEMVEAIKSVSREGLVCRDIFPFQGEEFTLNKITDKGKYLMESKDGEFITISKEDYEKEIETSLLERINEKFDAGVLLNKYMLPFFNGDRTLVKVEDILEGKSEGDRKKLKNMGTYSRWHTFKTFGCWEYKSERDYYDSTTTIKYNLECKERKESCTIYLDVDGNLRNRNYHVNFEKELNSEYEPLAVVFNNYVNHFKELNIDEFEYHNEKWFCGKFVIHFNPTKDINIQFKQIPHQNKTSYYISGQSYDKIKKPKSVEKVNKQHLIDFVENKLIELGELYDPLLEVKYQYSK